MAYTIAQGTAIAALLASSLMCTLESNEPMKILSEFRASLSLSDAQIVHSGARKDRMNA